MLQCFACVTMQVLQRMQGNIENRCNIVLLCLWYNQYCNVRMCDNIEDRSKTMLRCFACVTIRECKAIKTALSPNSIRTSGIESHSQAGSTKAILKTGAILNF